MHVYAVSFVFGFVCNLHREHAGKVWPCTGIVIFICEYGIVKVYDIKS
jgi:hypothetical protein